jgi:hypothetical protein
MNGLIPTDDVVDGEPEEEEFLVDDDNEPARADLVRVGARYGEPIDLEDVQP